MDDKFETLAKCEVSICNLDKFVDCASVFTLSLVNYKYFIILLRVPEFEIALCDNTYLHHTNHNWIILQPHTILFIIQV